MKATVTEWKAFFHGPVSKEISVAIDERIKELTESFIDENDTGELSNHRDRIREALTIKELPQLLFEEAEQIEKEQEDG